MTKDSFFRLSEKEWRDWADLNNINIERLKRQFAPKNEIYCHRG
jgi:hypothetical protein